jgi:hypothetical protein
MGANIRRNECWRTTTSKHDNQFNWSHVSVMVPLRPNTSVIVVEERLFDEMQAAILRARQQDKGSR